MPSRDERERHETPKPAASSFDGRTRASSARRGRPASASPRETPEIASSPNLDATRRTGLSSRKPARRESRKSCPEPKQRSEAASSARSRRASRGRRQEQRETRAARASIRRRRFAGEEEREQHDRRHLGDRSRDKPPHRTASPTGRVVEDRRSRRSVADRMIAISSGDFIRPRHAAEADREREHEGTTKRGREAEQPPRTVGRSPAGEQQQERERSDSTVTGSSGVAHRGRAGR